MNTGEKAICLEGDKAIKLCKEIKIRPDLDLYIHPTFEKTKRGDKIPLVSFLLRISGIRSIFVSLPIINLATGFLLKIFPRITGKYISTVIE